MNNRSCHVLSCDENEALDVITTIGQAFELRYNEYMHLQQTNEQQGYEKIQLIIHLFVYDSIFYFIRMLKSLERDELLQQVNQ